MTLEKLEELGRQELPSACEYEHDRIRLAIQKTLDITFQLDFPISCINPYYEIEFRKQIINHIVVGWEFVGLLNGI